MPVYEAPGACTYWCYGCAGVLDFDQKLDISDELDKIDARAAADLEALLESDDEC